jgi:NADH:ubiquinone oxidoreductase subunit H
LLTGSVNFEQIIDIQNNISIFFILPTLSINFFLATLMETNRPPFDLSEAESDVVAGYIVEYSGIIFGLFYLGEYINIFSNSFFILIIFSNYISNLLVFLNILIIYLYQYINFNYYY